MQLSKELKAVHPAALPAVKSVIRRAAVLTEPTCPAEVVKNVRRELIPTTALFVKTARPDIITQKQAKAAVQHVRKANTPPVRGIQAVPFVLPVNIPARKAVRPARPVLRGLISLKRDNQPATSVKREHTPTAWGIQAVQTVWREHILPAKAKAFVRPALRGISNIKPEKRLV